MEFRVFTKELKSNSAIKLPSRQGQLLVEAVVAISILTVGLMGILGLLTQSFHLNAIVVDNYRGSYLAAEGIEVVKNIIDHNNILNINHENQCTCPGTIVPWNGLLAGGGYADGNYEVDYGSKVLQPYSGQPLKFDPSSDLYGYTFGSPTLFKRMINVRAINADEILVKATVTWLDGSFLQKGQVDLSDTFYNKWPPLY